MNYFTAQALYPLIPRLATNGLDQSCSAYLRLLHVEIARFTHIGGLGRVFRTNIASANLARFQAHLL